MIVLGVLNIREVVVNIHKTFGSRYESQALQVQLWRECWTGRSWMPIFVLLQHLEKHPVSPHATGKKTGEKIETDLGDCSALSGIKGSPLVNTQALKEILRKQLPTFQPHSASTSFSHKLLMAGSPKRPHGFFLVLQFQHMGQHTGVK